MGVNWVLVPGGCCRYGDEGRPLDIPSLYWTEAPITVGQLGLPGEPGLPVTEIPQHEAASIAARFGGRLPRSSEWEWMAAGPQRRRYPWGERPWTPELANLRDSGRDTPTPVTAHRQGATPDGVRDVAGNVWEWTGTRVMGNGYVIRGGSFDSPALYAQCTFLNAAPAELRSRGIGVRVVREP
ncbi:formylglycine-generating enzyme family protein [Actinomadura monticuli]|uniref:SUMF1/EgtB/PvdO family nonheme iron enzyme n=1 Tax=Actinomadura monticuli TaxID=3097367 RepID=A0ABV4QLH0_9ACTN